MGREIRRVPKNWEHPKDENGRYKPMYDETYEDAAREWLDNCIAWDNDSHSDLQEGKTTKTKHPFFWEWSDKPPDRDWYRPAYNSDANCYQIYETVSEGTPTSPVFETLANMRNWLLRQGHSEKSADNFINNGWAPSMVIVGRKLSKSGIDSYDLMCPTDPD